MEPINLSKSNARSKPGWKPAPVWDIWPACSHPPPQLWSKQPLCALLSANVWHAAASLVDHELSRMSTMHLKLLSMGLQAWTWSLHLMAVNRSRLPLSWQKATWAQTRCLHLHTCRICCCSGEGTVFHSRPNEAAADFHICSVIIQL